MTGFEIVAQDSPGLRARFAIDEAVAGIDGEPERILALRRWSRLAVRPLPVGGAAQDVGS